MILTIDLGTSATKVGLWNDTGLLAMGRAPLHTDHPAVGRSEQDPLAWWPSVLAARPAGEVDLVVFCGARRSYVGVDARGAPLGPAVLWSDRRVTADEPPDPAAALLLSPRDFVVFCVTGVLATDQTMAFGDRQPEVVPSTTVIGGVLPEAASALGVRAGTPVVIGAGDRQCEVLGSGASPARPMVSWGTAANVSVPVAAPSDVPGIRVTRAAIDGWLLEGGVSAAGSFLAWLGELTGDGNLLHEAADSPPGARGVVALPWLDGARAPWWRSDAGAAFLNLTPAHGRADLARAAVESVAWEIDRCLRRAAPEARGLILAGGGAADGTWVSVLTEITGLPAQRRRHEAASAGAAMLATGWDVDDINPVVDEHTPDPARIAIYRDLRDELQRIAETIIRL